MQILSIQRKKRIHSIAFSPSGRQLATTCGDGYLRLWDLTTGAIIQAVPIEETSCGYDLDYVDENRLVFAGVELRLWDLSANRWSVVRTGLRWGGRLCFSPDGRYLAEVDQVTSTGSPGSGLHFYETAEWKRLPPVSNAADTTGGVSFSSDGRWLATGHIVRVGERQRSYRFFAGSFSVPEYEYLVHIREMPSGKIVQSVNRWQQGVSHLEFSPNGTILVGTAGPRLRIWDIERNRELASHKRGTKHFQGLSFTADGRYLATVSNDETVRLWETASWQERTTFTWGIGKLLHIAFAPDGFRAAAGSDSGQIVIWDVED
jgi:WD40 repeat protein